MVAAFIIANGAAAMDDEVTMFFTFWGLNALRRPEKVATSGKSPLQKAFSAMMPRGPGRLNALAHELRRRRSQAHEANDAPAEGHAPGGPHRLAEGAGREDDRLRRCRWTSWGCKAEELIDGLEYAGVASYLGDADEANVNLFI